MPPRTQSPSLGVLDATPPRFGAEQVAAVARRLFALEGVARDLGSERDQTFMIEGGAAGGVLKISNLGERPEVLDFEAAALAHIAVADPALPVARQLPRPGAADPPDPEDLRPTFDGPDGVHFVRLFERLHGRSTATGVDLDDAAIRAYGATTARLARALRGLFHPGAGRRLMWDTKHAAGLRPLAAAIEEPRRRAIVERVVDRHAATVAPAWPRLRAQVVHGDLALDNVLLDDRGRVTGIVDFGDVMHTALVADLAAALASVLRGRQGADVLRTARIFLDGYQAVTPLEPAEHALVGDVLAARLATIVTISAWRVRRYPENAEYIQAWDAGSWPLLELFDDLGPAELARRLGAPSPPAPSEELAARRDRALGPAITRLTYARPVHLASGEGAWLVEADGRRLLDAYNNVPVVGHCHPRVTEAVVRQTRRLNTHARYLYEPLVELAERLAATMPAGSGLDVVMVVNSGSEANDLAWRIATTVTGNAGGIVTAFAYHGVTTAIADLSPEEWPPGARPPHVETLAGATGAFAVDAAALRGAADRLASRGIAPAAVYLDGGFTSDGILTPPASDVAALADAAREAGALLIADEVQAGHGRTGEHLWSFQCYGLTPDMVTLGKPMGNGYPVAAVIARRDLVERFARETEFFSTFGGNPVAAAAGLAVLDVIADERLVEHAGRVGERLRDALQPVARRHGVEATVRGRGLLVGVELAAGAALATAVVDGMRERGVLIGRTGPRGDVLKLRPPLAFGEAEVGVLVEALDDALAVAVSDVAVRPGRPPR